MAQNDRPLTIAVIIPAYNEGKFIRPCLEALENQTRKPDEIIVVDNNSTDDTAEVAAEYPLVKVVTEKRPGISWARDAGFNAASSDVLARIDADTIADPDWLAKLAAYLLAHPEVGAVAGAAYFHDVPRWLRGVTKILFIDSFYQASEAGIGHVTLYGSNMGIRRSLWSKVKGEVCHDDRHMHEDIDLAQHAWRYGLLAYEPTITVGISARPLRSPRNMLRRNIKGIQTFRRHWAWRHSQPGSLS